MTTIPKPPVHHIAIYQLVILLSLSGLLFYWDVVAGCSALLGGLIQIGPQAWFGRQAFKYTGARQARKIVQTMYRGETGKIVLTAALFITVFRLVRELNVAVFFISFVLMIPLQAWLAVKVLFPAQGKG